MEERIISVCIVGGGFGKRTLLPVCIRHPNLRVSSLVVKEQIPEDVSKHVPVFTDLARALRETDAELVLIASPHSVHEYQVDIALDAGKHVLCEKPLATSFRAARVLQQKCVKLKLIGGVDYSFRFIPARAHFTDLVRSGAIGAVRFLYLSFFRDDFDRWPSKWYYDRNQGGGMLLATGSHLVDSARLLLTSQVTSLEAVIYEHGGIDTGFMINLKTESDVACMIAASHQIPGQGKHLIEAHGVDGSMFLNHDGTIIKVEHGVPNQCPIPTASFIGFRGEKWNGEPRLQPAARVVDEIVSAILESRPLVSLSFEEGVENQKILDAAWEAHLTKRKVSLNECE